MSLALFRTVLAARCKAAARFGVDGGADLASDDLNFLLSHGDVGNGNGGKQSLSVRMHRVCEEFLVGSFLDTLSHIHNHDLVRDMFYNGKVVGYEHVGKFHFLLEIHEQVQNLSLNGYVQSTDGLVANDELGFKSQGSGDADTLTAAAVQLMRIGVDQSLGKTYGVHQFLGALVKVCFRLAHLVNLQRHGDGVGDGHTGIQAGIGILEDNLQFLSVVAHLVLTQLGNVLTIVENLAFSRFNEPEYNSAQSALSASRLTYNAQCSSLGNADVDVINGVKLLRGDVEVFLKSYCLNEGDAICDNLAHYSTSLASSLLYNVHSILWLPQE